MSLLLLLLACNSKVSSSDEAEAAWVGLDTAVDRALGLGMDGFNAASSANIDDQTADGDSHGTMVVSGQVDQGSSDNKTLRLSVALTEYSDTLGDDGEPDIVYDTDAPASLELKLQGIPDGTLEGTFAGTFAMDGDLTGEVELQLVLAAELEADADGGVQRAEGTTHATGTATSDYGTYDVDVTR
jgi:hypothetical protein